MMKMIAPISRRRGLQLALGCLAGTFIGSQALAPRGKIYHRPGIAFGTTLSITLEAASAAQAEAAFAASFQEIRHLDRLAGLVRPDSELFRLNRDGKLDNPDPALIEMLRMAQLMHDATDGVFDVTVQPLWLALDTAAKRGTWPSPAEIAALCQYVDQTAIDITESRIAFSKAGMAITLNSLARGLAADRVAQALSKHDIINAFLDTDVLQSLGTPHEGRAWQAQIRDPREHHGAVATSPVRGSLATSGDYQYFWSQDFERNHIINPRDGVSPQDFSSVSVLASSGLLADALSTAVFLVGREKAPTLLKKFHAEAFFVAKDGTVSKSAGFPTVAMV